MGFDFNQHGGHQQIFGGKFQIAAANFIHIAEVLAGQGRHGDVKDVEVLFANQVEQKIQRALKGFQKNFQCIRRDVQVLRQRKQGLAVQPCHGHVVNHLGHAVVLGVGGVHAANLEQ